MTETMLGCPHCGKPVGFPPAMAGLAVACPYCKRAFQMPGRPAAIDTPPPDPPTATKDESPPIKKDAPAPKDQGPSVPIERDPYRAATSLANLLVLVGSAAVVLTAIMIAFSEITPYFERASFRPLYALIGILWSLVLVAFAAVAIIVLHLVRALVHIAVDKKARPLPATECSAPELTKSE